VRSHQKQRGEIRRRRECWCQREREGVVPRTEEKKKGRGEWGDRVTGREKREREEKKERKEKKGRERMNLILISQIFCGD
jgi:hypothetical protein